MALGGRKERSVCARYGNRFYAHFNSSLSRFFRCVEALTRAGQHDKAMLQKSITMFEASGFIYVKEDLVDLSVPAGFPLVP
jgi:hypothetical protein